MRAPIPAILILVVLGLILVVGFSNGIYPWTIYT